MLSIQKRTRKVRDAINRKWHERYLKFINDNLDKSWNWFEISRNPNITMKNINDNPDIDWDWSEISRNPFTKEKEEFIEQKYREHYSTIQ